MARQLNIRSDEAYAIAHEVAEMTGRPVGDVVLAALREYGAKVVVPGELTPKQKVDVARIRAIARRAAARRRPGVTFEEIMNEMYDEKGLPI
jgi:hypothetical protein